MKGHEYFFIKVISLIVDIGDISTFNLWSAGVMRHFCKIQTQDETDILYLIMHARCAYCCIIVDATRLSFCNIAITILILITMNRNT